MLSLRELETVAGKRLGYWLKKIKTFPELQKRVLHKGTGSMPGFEVDLSVCSAPQMVKINTAFRKKKYATDVLSFPADRFFQEKGFLGDLVICGPVLLKQAKEQDHDWKTELDVLIVHGLLHLFHFDHEKGKAEAKKMKTWEEKLLGAKRRTSLITRATKLDERRTGRL
jgi:rRNA maturation RNase YbeY